jgi:TPR repeat protein
MMALLSRGNDQLQHGNVAAARLYYQRAADTGLAQAALALGSTCDPDELVRLSVVGTQPDRELARRWYERARELGAPEAERRRTIDIDALKKCEERQQLLFHSVMIHAPCSTTIERDGDVMFSSS